MRGWTSADIAQLLLCARDDVLANKPERAKYFLQAVDSPVARRVLKMLEDDGTHRDEILAALGESSEGVKVMNPSPKECHKVRR